MDDKTRFKDKVVYITGGTSGIGLASAVSFAREGAAQVIVCGRRQAKWQQAQLYIEKYLTKDQQKVLHYWPCDVRIEQESRATVKKIFDEFGRLDICFNNAGVQPSIPSGAESGFIGDIQFESMLGEDGSILFRVPPPQPTSGANQSDVAKDPSQSTAASPFSESELATSCIGVFYSLKWEAHYIFALQPKNLPVAIINTSSRNGVLPDAHRPLYAASKAFIIALTKSLANQFAQKSTIEKRQTVRVNAISPGPVDTPLEFAAFGTTPIDAAQYQAYVKAAAIGVPMRRTAQPEEIAPTVLFLSDEKASSYITGTNISVDGGHTGSPLLCVCP